MLNKLLLAATLFVTFDAAVASDLPSKKSQAVNPAVSAPAFSWTGCYIGLNGGAGWGRAFHYNTFHYGTTGGVAGGQLGCNYQISSFVIGLEAELDYSTLHASPYLIDATMYDKGGFAGDVALRAGFAFDRVLAFGKAGWSVANHRYSIAPEDPLGSHANYTHSGLMLGAGVEYAFTDHWTAKVEYDHSFYNMRNIAFYRNGTGAFNLVIPHKKSENLIKIGVNYRF